MTTTSTSQTSTEPITEPVRLRAERIAGEVWSWLNRHDSVWSPSDATVDDLAFAIVETLDHDEPAREAALVAAGFEKVWLLAGHPAYPDPLRIYSAERAAEVYADYVAPTFEEYITALGHTPRRLGGDPYTAETFNPRILITWDFVGDREVWVPEG